MRKKQINYFLIFPGTRNVHLIKDVGMIPYILYKYYNYNSYIATYNNDDYKYLNNEVSGLKIVFLNNKFKYEIFNVLEFIIKKRKDIDVLQLFHLSLKTFIYALFYKLFNKNGKLYIKLDADDSAVERMIGKKKGFKYIIKKYITNFYVKYIFDFVSIETKKNYNILINSEKDIYRNKLFYLPNGFYFDDKIIHNDLSNKDNYMLTVGRLGTKQKATDVLLDAFSKIKDLQNWKLILVGPIEEEFKKNIDTYFEKNPHLRDKIQCTGNISDRELIYKYYSRAKIFILPSRWEGFSLALIEAAYFGCYIVSTDVGGARDILDETGYGQLFKIDDSNELAEILQDLIINWDKYKREPNEINKIINEKFNWVTLCENIDNKIKQII